MILEVIYVQIPIVEDESKRVSGEKVEEDSGASTSTVSKLVTSDGTYATQSAFNTNYT